MHIIKLIYFTFFGYDFRTKPVITDRHFTKIAIIRTDSNGLRACIAD